LEKGFLGGACRPSKPPRFFQAINSHHLAPNKRQEHRGPIVIGDRRAGLSRRDDHTAGERGIIARYCRPADAVLDRQCCRRLSQRWPSVRASADWGAPGRDRAHSAGPDRPRAADSALPVFDHIRQVAAAAGRVGRAIEAPLLAALAPMLGYLNVRLTQWRQDDAQQNNLPTPDLGPMASGIVVLGVATGGLDCFLSPDGGGGSSSARYTGPERQLTGGPSIGGVAPQQYPKTIPPSAGRMVRGNSGQAALEALYGPNGRRAARFNTSLGDRLPDYVVEQGGRIYAHESNVQAVSVRAGSFKIREARKDGELQRTIPGYTAIWHFWDGGPTAELARILKQEGIGYIVYNR
jgi:hypothetical protein